MNPFAATFLGAVCGALALRLWLARRQVVHVRTHRETVPAALAGVVPLSAHRRAADYAVAKARFDAAAAGLETALLLVWTLGGGLGLLDRVWSAAGLPPVAAGTGLVVSALVLAALLRLPIDAWQRFAIDGRFGFNRATPRLFLADGAKRLALLAAAAIPPAALAAWLAANTDPWWVGVWALWTAVVVAEVWVRPVLVLPLFERLGPLADGPLRRRLKALLGRCGVAPCVILVADGSRRSTRANACFVGLGRTRRIVLQDSLVRSLAADEIEAVVAHEVGHLAGRHVGRDLVLRALTGLAVLAPLGWLSDLPGFREGVGLGGTSPAALLAWTLLALPPLGLFARPPLAAARRRFEIAADAYAARHADPRSLSRALAKLCSGNAETLTPDPLHAAFFRAHPSPVARLDRLERLASGR